MGEIVSENKATLYKKMAQVMGQLERIKETGVHSQRWTYATSEDVKDAVRGALASAGLALLVDLNEYQIVELQKGILVRGRMSFTLCCSETGESVTTSLWGEAADQQAVSDKAFYKLYTSLQKYWLKTTFLISSGDELDSDADNIIDAKPKAAPKPKNGNGVSAKKKAWDAFLAKARVELNLAEDDAIAILSELKFTGFTPEEANKPFELLRQQMEDSVTTEAGLFVLVNRETGGYFQHIQHLHNAAVKLDLGVPYPPKPDQPAHWQMFLSGLIEYGADEEENTQLDIGH